MPGVEEKKPRSFFSKRKHAAAHEEEDIDDKSSRLDAPIVNELTSSPLESIPPVSFTALFRFTTRFELFLDVVGIAAASGAGAAMPLMSLIFGNLTQSFVNFQLVISQAASNGGQGEASIQVAAANFRRVAAQDASYLVYIGIGMLVCTFLYMMTWNYTAEINAKRLRERYLKAILRQNISYFDNIGAGEVATRIQTDTHLVQQGISEKVALVANFISAFLTGFILAYIRQWKLALALSSIIPCIAITGGIMNKFVSSYMQQSLKHVAEGGTVAEEVISTIRTAQAFGSQSKLGVLYDNHIQQARTVDLKGAVWQGGGVAVFFFVIYSSYALSFSFGTTLINAGQTNAGAVINVFMAILIGSFSLALLAPEMQAISYARGAAAKLYATIDRVPEIDSADPGGLKPEKCIGHIELDNVKFNYPSRPNIPILKEIDLYFEAGKTVALVGASGSGKSTIVSMVERFYDPLSGVVKVDGIDVKELNLKWLRNQIGLVSQEPVLFATTIRNNVGHGLIGSKWENVSEEEKTTLIQEACTKANAHGFITKLPDGYDTMVGERGFLLSGGQKQRIAIARAIVSDPRILLLDEATSALDTQSEGIVQDALDKAAAGRTTITIAHRLSTIKNADCIHVMGEGMVLESGTHDELLQNENGAYARLVHAQKLRETSKRSSSDMSDSATESGDEPEDIEKAVREEIPLGRKETGSRSLASEILEKRKQDDSSEMKHYSMLYLFKRIGALNPSGYKRYFFGSIFAILSGCVYPAFGIVFSLGISAFSAPTAHERRIQGDRIALWLFLIALCSTVAIGFQNFLFTSAAAQLTSVLRMRSFKSILRQDIEYFDKDENSTGALTTNLSDSPQKVNGLAGITLGAIVQSVSTVVAGSIIGLIFAWKLALVGMACMPFVISAGYIRLRVVVLKDDYNRKAHEESAQLACEAAGAIRTVASLAREDDCCEIYSESLEEPLRASNRTALSSDLFYATSQAMSFWVIALIFWYGSILVSRQEISTFKFFVSLMSTTFGSIQAGNVFSFVPDISSANGAATKIINLIDSEPVIDAESNEGQIPSEIRGHIRFEDVHFRYPTRPGVRVLKELSLTVEPGSFVAIVGPSGSGKSTTIQLLERFYDPIAGNVYIDGHLVSDLNVSAYRQHIALVSQEPTLYAGTIRFNILMGAVKPAEDVTQAELERAASDANILDFIRSLPNGFDTEVGGKGSQLSGGQKQRIAIARALLRNPKVLLLDEATSALDSNSEKVVQAALDVAAKGRTTIAIAHRLSTIQNADCIYFIKDGAVSESGTHDQLLALKGGYYEYVQLQALSKK